MCRYLFFSLLVICSVQETTSAAVPPGFERLLEPQTTQVDVYYGGRFLEAAIATFTPDEIRFAEPASIVRKIPDLLDTGVLTSRLAGGLSTNSGLVCLKRNQTACGVLAPEDFGLNKQALNL